MICGMCKRLIELNEEWYEVRRFRRTDGLDPEITFGQFVCVPCMEAQDSAATLTKIRYGGVPQNAHEHIWKDYQVYGGIPDTDSQPAYTMQRCSTCGAEQWEPA